MRADSKAGLVILFIFVLASNCALAQTQTKSSTPAVKSVKTAKQQMREHTEDLRALMQKLYEYNPEELAKSTQVGAREMTEWVFDGKAGWKFEGLRRLQNTQALALVFDPEFNGDHVLALIVGLETMLFQAYGGVHEFDIPELQDAQQHLRVTCTLNRIVEKMHSQDAQAKAVLMLERPDSRHDIQQTLQNISQRMTLNSPTSQNCPTA
jgi:hypothetical protein